MLVAFEETYRCYRSAIATGIWTAFPDVERPECEERKARINDTM